MAEADIAECNDCGTPLSEKPDGDPDKRVPCPICGSKARKFFVRMEARIQVEARVSATLSTTSPSNLVLQMVVVPGERVEEGRLIEAVTLPWFEIIERLEKDPDLVHKMPARLWEEIVAGAYKKAGFDEVILTPRSGDYGRDVIAIKKGLGSIRVIDQVKAYKPGHLVTANDVRALLGVLQGDGASKGFITTTSDFAPRIKEDPLLVPFMPSRLELINGAMLLKRLQELARIPPSRTSGAQF